MMPFLIALRNHWDTLVVFFSAAAFLIYALCMFAHLRLLAAVVRSTQSGGAHVDVS